MIKGFPRPMARIIEEFSRMPGIGVRSAERIAFYLLRSPGEYVEALARAIREVKSNVRFCSRCNNLSEHELCSVCSDPSRDASRICVVEGPNGVIAMEKCGIFRGTYHVLLGQLSPIEGIGPEQLKIKELLERVEKEKVKEVVIATDFTTEGETTALYLSEVLKSGKVTVSRLARGVPVGASLEYADVATLQRAFEERRGV
ncbi:MAG: recombination mediator RecR [Candidatus Omnitrophica bacterium]|nr:recombination mediator RecR [Candidatus Omnitrophota bacterium]